MNIDRLVENIISGQKRYISMGITLLENENSNSLDLMKKIHNNVGKALRIGITGPPGAGRGRARSSPPGPEGPFSPRSPGDVWS